MKQCMNDNKIVRALRVQKAIQSSRFQKPPFVAICVNSGGGSLV